MTINIKGMIKMKEETTKIQEIRMKHNWCQGKTILSNKIKGNLKNRNFKIPHQTMKIHLYQKANPWNDLLNLKTKNPS